MERSALLLIDCQSAFCEDLDSAPFPALRDSVKDRDIVSKAAVVLAAARQAGVFVVFTRVAFDPSYGTRSNRTPRWDRYEEERTFLVDSPESQISPGLRPLATEAVLTKGAVDPFVGTPLLAMLAGRSITEVAVVGVATNLAVESTVRHGADCGLSMMVIEDLCASFSDAAHEFTVTSILPLFGRVIGTEDYLQRIASGNPTRTGIPET